MAVETRITVEADGTIVLEIEAGDSQYYVELDQPEAAIIYHDLQSILEAEWKRDYEEEMD